eukprot:3146825-Pleurochrysis_carterae.AAC.2
MAIPAGQSMKPAQRTALRLVVVRAGTGSGHLKIACPVACVVNAADQAKVSNSTYEALSKASCISLAWRDCDAHSFEWQKQVQSGRRAKGGIGGAVNRQCASIHLHFFLVDVLTGVQCSCTQLKMPTTTYRCYVSIDHLARHCRSCSRCRYKTELLASKNKAGVQRCFSARHIKYTAPQEPKLQHGSSTCFVPSNRSTMKHADPPNQYTT